MIFFTGLGLGLMVASGIGIYKEITWRLNLPKQLENYKKEIGYHD